MLSPPPSLVSLELLPMFLQQNTLTQINMQEGTKDILSRISIQPHISHSNIQLYPSEMNSIALK